MPAGRRGKISIEILGGLTAAAAQTLTRKNDSTFSILACLPSPYVFLFVNDSRKLNVHMNYTGRLNALC